MQKELNMEDIGSIASDAVDDILTKIQQYKIFVSEEKMIDIIENDIHEAIRSKLEDISNGCYPNQMG